MVAQRDFVITDLEGTLISSKTREFILCESRVFMNLPTLLNAAKYLAMRTFETVLRTEFRQKYKYLKRIYELIGTLPDETKKNMVGCVERVRLDQFKRYLPKLIENGLEVICMTGADQKFAEFVLDDLSSDSYSIEVMGMEFEKEKTLEELMKKNPGSKFYIISDGGNDKILREIAKTHSDETRFFALRQVSPYDRLGASQLKPYYDHLFTIFEEILSERK